MRYDGLAWPQVGAHAAAWGVGRGACARRGSSTSGGCGGEARLTLRALRAVCCVQYLFNYMTDKYGPLVTFNNAAVGGTRSNYMAVW